MADLRRELRTATRWVFAPVTWAALVSLIHAQQPPVPGMPEGPSAARSRYSSVEISGASSAAADDAPTVLDVRIVGNQAIKAERIRRHIRTRRERPLVTETVEEDVRRLNATRYFLDVKPLYQEVPGGVVVIFKVVERPTLTDVIYVGNKTAKDKVLAKQTGLKVGGAVDPYSIEDAHARSSNSIRNAASARYGRDSRGPQARRSAGHLRDSRGAQTKNQRG